MPTDQPRLELGEEAVEELMILARATTNLPRVVEAAGQVPPQVGTAAVARQVSQKTGLAVSEVRPLLVYLLNFYHTQVRLKRNAAETADAITRNLERTAKTSEDTDRLKEWENARSKIVEVASTLHPDHPLEAAYKAYRVATSRQYELVDTRIFTDVRPVFNEAGDAIVQTVITHVLSLDYHDGHDHRVIQFTLDASDVAELRELCDRAERKATIIKRDIKPIGWPTTIFREPTDQASKST